MVAVCGSSRARTCRMVWAALDALRPAPDLVVASTEPGAARCALEWAESAGVPSAAYGACWSSHGASAPAKRNAAMLRWAQPSVVLAFPGGRDTANLVRQAEAAGIEVRRHS